MSPLAIVVAPDSFKGSLSAPEVCAAVGRGLARAIPGVDVRARPMADGGEGTLDAVLASAGSEGVRKFARVRGAGGEAVDAAYGIVGGDVAVIEIAQVVSITDASAMRVAVGARHTGGVGELLRALLDGGLRKFMVGLGGSSTNDGGAGMLAALGLRLLDAAGNDIVPSPAGLAALSRVDASALDPRLAEAAITVMSDVNNPLVGPGGATAVFGPQKGVRGGDIALLDAALARYAAAVEAALGKSAANLPGAGAAGGLGYALQLVGGAFRSGAEVVSDLVGLDAALAGARWAITGEGRSDAQTLLRKAPFVVAERARRQGVPTSLLSGAIDTKALPELNAAFAGCFALPAGPATLEACIENAPALLADRAEAIGRVLVHALRGSG